MIRSIQWLRGVWILLAVLPALQVGFAQDNSAEGNPPETTITEAQQIVFGRDLISQWRMLTGPENRTAAIDKLVLEGEALLNQADVFIGQASLALLSGGDSPAKLHMLRLKNKFLIVLRDIELERAKGLPPDQLRQIADRYRQERARLSSEIAANRRDLIVRAENFIATYPSNELINRLEDRDEIVTDVMARLADMYYAEADEEWSKRYAEWSLVVDELPEGAAMPEEPQPDYSKALAMYRRIVEEFPTSSLVDQALYNIAAIESDMGSFAAKSRAKDTLEKLVAEYPKSQYTPEAFYRIGSFYFGEKADMDEAIPYFEAVLDHPDSPFYADALYMLGWCYYRKKPADVNDRQTADQYYQTAVDYFDRTIEYAFDQKEKQTSDEPLITMSDEAIQYLAICFALDPEEWSGSGVDSAVRFLEENPKRKERYGFKMLVRMGQVFRRDVGNFTGAIDAYYAAVDLYPVNPRDPWVEENVIPIYMDDLLDEVASYREREQLFERYRRGTVWDEANHELPVRQDADTLIALYYYQYFNWTLRKALESDDPSIMDQAVQIAENYLSEFPKSDKASKIQFYMGSFFAQNSQDPQRLSNAYEAYKDVVLRGDNDNYRQKAAEGMVSVAMDLMKLEATGVEIPDPSFKLQEEIHPANEERTGNPAGDAVEPEGAGESDTVPNPAGDGGDAGKSPDQGFINPAGGELQSSLSNGFWNEVRDLTPLGWDALEFAYASLDGAVPPQDQTPEDERPMGEQATDGDTSAVTEPVESDAPGTDAGGVTTGDGETTAPVTMQMQAAEKMEAVPLSKGEKLFVSAVDLFVENFPDSPKADTLIMKVGEVYLNKHNYPESRKYFEKLIAEYPNSALYGEAFRGILKGYQENGDYRLAEETTRRIEAAGITGDLLKDAMLVRGEAIYMTALDQKKAGNGRDAALNFRRIALDVPDAEFADQSLWESGITFMEIKDWQEAIASFELLVHRYPDSEWMPKAYSNIAFIYESELNLPGFAAATYDTLAMTDPDSLSQLVQVALSRASVNYEKVQDWDRLLRIHQVYLQRFPDSPDAVQWLFDMARFYLKKGDEAQAMKIYQDFAAKYPDDPRTVQANFEPGEYYLERGDIAKARKAFEATLEANRHLLALGEKGNPVYASRAKEVLTNWKFAEFKAITYPADERGYETARAKKEKLREELIADYTELRDYFQKESFHAYYRIAELTELMAEAWWKRPRTESSDPVVLIEQRREVADSTISMYLAAIEDYRSALKALDEQIESFNKLQMDNRARYDALSNFLVQTQKSMAGGDVSDSAKAEMETAVADSQNVLNRLGDRISEIDEWIALGTAYKDSTAGRIPEVALINADVAATVPFVVLKTPSEGKRRWMRVMFRLNLLNEAAVPAGVDLVKEYISVVNAADTCIADKRNVAETARQRIIGIGDTLYAEYMKSFNYAIDSGYNFYIENWEWMIRSEDPTSEAYGLFIDEVPDEITLYQEQIFNFGVGLEDMCAEILKTATVDEGGRETYLTFAKKALGGALSTTDQLEKLRNSAVKAQERHRKRLAATMLETEQIGVQGYDLIIDAWNERMPDILAASWTIPEDLLLQPQPETDQIARRLVEFDPTGYAYLLGIEETFNEVITDLSWLATTETVDPANVAYDNLQLEPVREGGFPGALEGLEDIEGTLPIPISLYRTITDTLLVDTLVIDVNYVSPDTTTAPGDSLETETGEDSAAVENDTIPEGYILEQREVVAEQRVGYNTVYYLYRFDVSDRLTDAELFITADNDYTLYFNGEFVTADGTDDETDWMQIEDNPFVLEYLHPGENQIVVKVDDPDQTGGGLWMKLVYVTIPEIREDMKVVLPGQ